MDAEGGGEGAVDWLGPTLRRYLTAPAPWRRPGV